MSSELTFVCEACGEEEVKIGRRLLGYKTCLICGEEAAKVEIARKGKAIMPMHKSNTVYVGQNKQLIKDISRMRKGEED